MAIDASLPDLPAQRHRQLLVRGAVSAGAAHACFLVLFAGLGVAPLAWFNAGSVLFYAGGAWWSLHRRLDWLFPAITLEVVAHAALATLWMGWDSGFHYYLFALLPVLFVGSPDSLRRNLLLAAGLGLLYLALDRVLADQAGRFAMSPQPLGMLRTINIAGAFAMAGYYSWYSAHSGQQSERELQRLATTDPLTGLANRRRLIDCMRDGFGGADTGEAPSCVVLADLDQFKRVNDEHGHEAGDAVLAEVAARLRATLAGGEPLARWGGEEFLAVLPGTALAEARQTAERLRAALRDRPVAASGVPLRITATIGLAQRRAGEPPGSCIARADAALYEGKRRGGDCVVLTPVEPSPGEPSPGEPSPGEPSPGEPSPGDHAPGDHAPGDHGPGDHAPGDHGPSVQAPSDRSPRADRAIAAPQRQPPVEVA